MGKSTESKKRLKALKFSLTGRSTSMENNNMSKEKVEIGVWSIAVYLLGVLGAIIVWNYLI